MAISFSKKTRKNCKIHQRDCNKDAKKGTHIKCRLKTCKAKKYQAVYGVSTAGSIRAVRSLYF